MKETFSLGHLRLCAISAAEARTWVIGRARDHRSCVVVTSNIHHLRLADENPAFREAVGRAELNVADGWPLLLANRLCGGPRLPDRVAGVDLVRSVVTETSGLRIAVLGGATGAAEAYAEAIRDRHDVVLVDPLVKGQWESDPQRAALRERLERARPNLVLLAIGAPKQEILADELREVVQGPILCCGASVEILAGLRPRAPRPVQSLGLEWAFRAAMEPARLLPRYGQAGLRFVQILARELRGRAAAMRRKRPPSAQR